MTALFVKTRVYFCSCNLCNQVNKQTQIPGIVSLYRLYSKGRTQDIPENVCSFPNGTPNQWAPTKNVPVYYDKFF